MTHFNRACGERSESITHAQTTTDEAIDAYIAHAVDPICERAPSLEQIRLVAQYCQEYIERPLPIFPSEDFLDLQRRVIHIRTLDDLARWLWDCRQINAAGAVMNDFWILDDDHNLIATDDIRIWGDWFGGNQNRYVAKTVVGDAVVSTVCLGIDHNWSGSGPPLLFETMIFRQGDGEECWRCATWDEAMAQHMSVVAELQGEL